MTSPVDTSVKLFNHTMANAPTLSGTAGSLIALLDACLVTGFDTKTLTSLVALAGVMTATFSGSHSSQLDTVVLVAGVAGGPTGWAGANGEQKVATVPSSTTRSWATSLPDGIYTGAITIKMAPVGNWSKPFFMTNVAVFKSVDVMANGHSLRVDDTGAQTARVVGYESMSDVNTGFGPFPAPAQMSGGGYWPKSSAANAVANGWTLVGDSRGFVLHLAPGLGASVTTPQGTTRGFGDARPMRPGGDSYATFLNYSAQSNPTSQHDGSLDWGGAVTSSFPRSFTGLGGAVAHGSYPYVGSSTSMSGIDPSLGAFPNPVDGALRVSGRYFANAQNTFPRAELPGIYSVPQSALIDTFRTGDRVPGTGNLAGRTLYALLATSTTMSGVPNGGTTGVSFLDVTGPWAR